MTRRMWIWVGTLLGIYLIVGLWSTAKPVGQLDTAGSTFASGPHGSLALQRLWQESHLSFEDWEKIPAFLPSSSQATFVSVAPDMSNYQKKDITALLQYASTGHEVVWVDSQDNPLFAKFQVTAQQTAAVKVRGILVQSGAASVSGVAQSWQNMKFTTQYELTGPGLKKTETLYEASSKRIPLSQVTPSTTSNPSSSANQVVIGVKLKYGKGTVVLWSAPSVWENGTIGQADNLRVVWSLIGNKAVLWDEYGHGYAAQSTLGWMFHGQAFLSIILFALALLLYLYKNVWRFGSVRNPAEGQPMLGTDFMDALTWHLRRRRLRPQLFVRLTEATKLRMARQDIYRPGVTEQVAQQRVRSIPSESLATAWDQWLALVRQGYQPRLWRQFLKQTRRLLLQIDAVQTPLDSGHDSTSGDWLDGHR